MSRATAYVCLLRGINVGGHRKTPMKELKSLLGKLGFEDMKTYLRFFILLAALPIMLNGQSIRQENILYGAAYYHEYMPYERLDEDVRMILMVFMAFWAYYFWGCWGEEVRL